MRRILQEYSAHTMRPTVGIFVSVWDGLAEQLTNILIICLLLHSNIWDLDCIQHRRESSRMGYHLNLPSQTCLGQARATVLELFRGFDYAISVAHMDCLHPLYL